MPVDVRQATPADTETVVAILGEAAGWIEASGQAMWLPDELSADRTAQDVAAGLFVIAECDGEPVGTVRFQLEDEEYWPDMPCGDSAFVHRLAVRRRFAGGGVSSALLAWALERTAVLGRRFLRLDCDASRPRLRAFYERFGFRHHSDRQVGPHFVSRYEIDVSSVERPAGRAGVQ